MKTNSMAECTSGSSNGEAAIEKYEYILDIPRVKELQEELMTIIKETEIEDISFQGISKELNKVKVAVEKGIKNINENPLLQELQKEINSLNRKEKELKDEMNSIKKKEFEKVSALDFYEQWNKVQTAIDNGTKKFLDNPRLEEIRHEFSSLFDKWMENHPIKDEIEKRKNNAPKHFYYLMPGAIPFEKGPEELFRIVKEKVNLDDYINEKDSKTFVFRDKERRIIAELRPNSGREFDVSYVYANWKPGHYIMPEWPDNHEEMITMLCCDYDRMNQINFHRKSRL